MNTKEEIQALAREAEDEIYRGRLESFVSGLRKNLQNPDVMRAPAFSWNKDPDGTIFDGTSGIPVSGYEGIVLVFFQDGQCFMKTWIEDGERNWKALGTY